MRASHPAVEANPSAFRPLDRPVDALVYDLPEEQRVAFANVAVVRVRVPSRDLTGYVAG